MPEKLVVGPFDRGLRNDVTPFNVDNTSFPTLINAYQWRGRVKRKRGTAFLARLQRFFNSTSVSYSNIPSINLVAGAANILTGFSLQTNGNIVPGTVTIIDTTAGQTYTDPSKDGSLTGSLGGTGTINYATGDITITGGLAHTITLKFTYNPDLPVLGIEDLQLTATQFPQTLAFDQTYSYNVVTANPYPTYDVSFYKNPSVGLTDGTTPYVPKTNATPVTWNGQDYQQFWTTNYENALWATNGIPVPFDSTNIGMQFNPITGIAIISPTKITITIANHGLVVGDFLFINEVTGTIADTINFHTGYVSAVVDNNNVTVVFPNAAIAGIYANNGIAQYLTNRSDITKDCIRWYDGDPTNGSILNPSPTPGFGWVNFCPPLSQFSFPIANLPSAQYYLVNCRMIVAFKDRLLFFGAVVQSSGTGPFYLQDTVVYSQNGTPYYTDSFSGSVLNPVNLTSILVPPNQTATPSAYFSDQTGFGGFISAGIAQPITTVSSNEDVLIVGFSTTQTRLVYSGNDIVPFNFFVINSELGSASPFSIINMDKGVITRGTRGWTITSQVESQRIDLEIPNEVFEIDLTQNGNERFCAVRDFINEWIYFTFPQNNETYRYPNASLFYNYRDNSWALFYETYTTYGSFRRQTGFTWQTIGLKYRTWLEWNDPWNSGNSTLLQQEVLAGNQQGFLIFRDVGTGEATSLYITSFSGATNIVTSPDHTLYNGEFIVITGVIGTVGSFVNGKTFSIFGVTQNTFQLSPDPLLGSSTYFGGGLITKIYVPFIQTKQFPLAWDIGLKTRIGVQRYLLTATENSQITLQIYLSENEDNPYNSGPIIPDPASTNGSLIYSTVLYTCPESTNLGLTNANINLQTPTAIQQSQLWHRINTSLIGDTIQLGFTLSEDQIRSMPASGISFSITGATQAFNCVLTCAGMFSTNQLVTINGVLGMIELNGKTYQVITSDATTVTLNIDSTGFTPYSLGGFATPVANINNYSEIELHGFVMDVSPSQMLV